MTNTVGGGRKEGVFLPSPHAETAQRVCQLPGPAWPRNIPLGTGQPGFVSSIFAPNYITLALLQDCTVKILLNLMINKNMTRKAEFGQFNISSTIVSTT